MRKFILIILVILFCVTLSGCKTNSLGKTQLDTKPKSKSELLKEAISNNYLTKEPENKGELKIYNIKPFKDKYLVLSEKYCGDGQRYTDLFLINEKYNITAWTSGEAPISMCFVVNKIDYEENTILFGTFNNYKWDMKQDKKVTVQINKIDVKFSNKENIKEDILIENGYIVVSSPISKLEQFNLYNEKNELQSSLKDLEEHGHIIWETKFNKINYN